MESIRSGILLWKSTLYFVSISCTDSGAALREEVCSQSDPVVQMCFIFQAPRFAFIKANIKWTTRCKQKSCAGKAFQLLVRQLGQKANPTRFNGTVADYFHAQALIWEHISRL